MKKGLGRGKLPLTKNEKRIKVNAIMRNCGLNVVRSANQSGEFNAKYEFVPSIPLLELHSKDDRVYSLGLGLEAFALYFTLPDILRTLSCKSILIRCHHASERVMRTDCCDK